jgi:TolB-like protein/tetratricopeptide (TPR) repeat protein/tRNA A-37 threonylcarbamoyl transferase component Bud32
MLCHYRIVERIGEGGMGVVWKALDTRLGRHVALKMLPAELAEDEARLRRFEREAKTVASLNHPNIVTLYSVEEDDGTPFITMELVEGKTLSEEIPRDGMTLERYFELAIPLTDALCAAHERGIIHRDLKPANIMVNREGRLKVLDFGLAKLREEPGAKEDEEASDPHELPTASKVLLTRPDQVVGTVPYMSPEQIHGDELDARTDLFSLGVLLHEMATGMRPFIGRSSAELISSILRDSPPPVTDLKVDFPNHVGRIVSRCLEKDPERRYQTAKGLRNELENLRQEVSVSKLSRRVMARRPARSWIPVSILAAVAVVAVLAISLWPGGLRWPGTGGGQPLAAQDAVAVLPLVNLTGDPEQDYLSEGISAALITQLSEVSGVRVVGRSAAWSRNGRIPPLRELARQLGVGVVVEGELQREEDRVRIDVKLTEPESGVVLWSEGFQAEAGELFPLQREIAHQLASVLSIPLSAKERQRLARDPTRSMKAYEFFLRGHRHMDGPGEAEGVATATEMFRQALRLDPEFALAHAGLSEALWIGYSIDGSREKLDGAESAARRALEIDPELPAAEVALARIFRSTGRYTASIDELRNVLANHPKPDEAQRELAWSYQRVGDLAEAEKCLRAAAALGSADWFNWNALGAFLSELGRFGEAREAFEKASVLAPGHVGMPDENLAAIDVQQGRFDEAIEAYERLPRPLRSARVASNIGTAYYFSSRPDKWTKAEEYYDLAVRLSPRSPVIRRNLADLYLDQDRKDEALHHYREALRLVEERRKDDPRNQTLRLEHAIYAAKAEKCEAAVVLALELSAELPQTAVNAHQLAGVFALCGRSEEALVQLRHAIDRGFSMEIIRQESEFRELRDDPVFRELTSGDGSQPAEASGG